MRGLGDRRIVYLLLPLVSTVTWGSNVVAGRFLVGNGFDSIYLTLLRFLIATPLVFGWVALRSPSVRADARGLAFFAVTGLLGIAGFNVALYSSLEYMPAGVTAFIVSTATPVIYLLSVASGRDRLRLVPIMGILLAGMGLYLLLRPGWGGYSLTGIMLALIAMISWSLYTLLVSFLSEDRDPSFILAWSMAWGTLYLIPVGVERATLSISFYEALIILYIAVVPGAIAYLTWNIGVERLGPSTPAFFIPLTPLSAAILAFLLLGESLTLMQVLGGLFIVASILLVTWRR